MIRWSGPVSVNQVVWEAVLELTNGNANVEFAIRDLNPIILERYPDFNLSNVGPEIYADCVNSPSRHHYSSNGDRYWNISRGRYRLYDPRRDDPATPNPNESSVSQNRRPQITKLESAHTSATEAQEAAESVLPPDLTPDERVVFDAIGIPSSHIDVIVRTTKLSISQVAGALLILELKGVVRQFPGKQFAKSNP